MSSEEHKINCTDCGEKAYVSKIDHESISKFSFNKSK